MPSIREFQTVVKELPAGGHFMVLQTPLAADASRTDIGWFTTIMFRDSPVSEAKSRIVNIDRVTTFVSHTPSGLRRKLKDYPVTTERLTLYPTRSACTASTRWGVESISATSGTPELSFEWDDLLPLLYGCIEVGDGVPLIDWLAENTTEVAAFLTGPGWLPATEEEFDSLKQQRGNEDEPPDEEDDDWEEANDPAYDRWR